MLRPGRKEDKYKKKLYEKDSCYLFLSETLRLIFEFL